MHIFRRDRLRNIQTTNQVMAKLTVKAGDHHNRLRLVSACQIARSEITCQSVKNLKVKTKVEFLCSLPICMSYTAVRTLFKVLEQKTRAWLVNISLQM